MKWFDNTALTLNSVTNGEIFDISELTAGNLSKVPSFSISSILYNLAIDFL